jgi:hypothetical protein
MRDETRRASALTSYMTAIATADQLSPEQKKACTEQAFQQAGFDLSQVTSGALPGLTDEQKSKIAESVKSIYGNGKKPESDPSNISLETQEEPA